MIKLGCIATDSATGLKGMPTHLRIEMNGNRHVLFQPHGINPQTGLPVDRIMLVQPRLIHGEHVDEPRLPVEVFGTEVEDAASGFKGIAIALVLHLSGCLHVEVQAKGALLRTGAAVRVADFDIRRLTGPALKPLSEDARQASELVRPSPVEAEFHHPIADET